MRETRVYTLLDEPPNAYRAYRMMLFANDSASAYQRPYGTIYFFEHIIECYARIS